MTQHHPTSSMRLVVCLAILAGLLAAAGLTTKPAAAVDSPKTLISNDIAVDTIWTRANSPYLVTAPIAVAASATLTIEPGVEVQFRRGSREFLIVAIGGKVIVRA